MGVLNSMVNFNLFQYASLGLVVEVSHKFVIIIWIGIFPVH